MHKAMTEIWWIFARWYDACMRGAGRMIYKRADGGDWIIFSLSEAHYFHASTLLWYSYIILFARYAADSNAMQWWSSFQNLQSEDVIPLRRWVEAVIWYWSHSGIKSATSTRSNQDDAPCCVSFDILPPGRSMKAISGVLKSPWGALSIGRIISLIGRLLLADRLGQRGG